MAWIIASVPFWVPGGFFLFSSFKCLSVKYPGETAADQAGQSMLALLWAGALFYVAARMVS